MADILPIPPRILHHQVGTRLRQLVVTIGLFWFNLEIWGRVVWTLVTW